MLPFTDRWRDALDALCNLAEEVRTVKLSLEFKEQYALRDRTLGM